MNNPLNVTRNRFPNIPPPLVNSAWSLFEYIWNPALILMSTPFFLRNLGEHNFGIWMFINATVGFGGILTTGIIPPVIKRLSTSIAHQDQNAMNSSVRGGISLALAGGACAAILIVCAFAVSGEALLGKISTYKTLLSIGITSAIILWIEQFDAVFIAILRGAEKYNKCAQAELLGRTLTYLLPALLISCGCNIYWIFAALIIAALFRLLARIYHAEKSVRIDSYSPDFASLKDILNQAQWGWLQGIGYACYNITDRFIVGAVLGASVLTHYTVASQLAIQVQAVAGALLSVIFPVISRSIATGSVTEVARITKMTIAGCWAIVSAACLALIYWRMELLTLWLGREMAIASEQILFYLAVAAWVQGLTVAPHFVLQGFGKFRIIALTGLLGGVASTIIMILLVSDNGAPGVGIGRIAYGCAMCFYFIPLYKLVFADARTTRQAISSPL